MRVSIETAHGLTRKMTIAVPSATFEGQFQEHVKKTAGQVKLHGFRPGKVPVTEVRRRFGPRLRQEVASELLQTSLQEAVQERELALASRPDVEITKLEAGADFEFTATFEVLPEFEIADLQALKIRQPVAEVSDTDVDAMIQTLREQRVNWRVVDREAREGDRLTIDYSLTIGGEVVVEEEDKSLIAGSADVLPELDQAVHGMTAGDTRVFPATLSGGAAPNDDDQGNSRDGLDPYGDDDATAATAEADPEPASETDETLPADDSASAPSTSRQAVGKVTVQAVEESSLPDLDDEFFDRFGVADEEEGEGREQRFRADVRDRMAVELGNALREAQRREALAELGRSHRFDLPQAMVDAEVAREKSRLERMLNDVPDELPPVFVAMAEQRVRVRLAVNKIVTTERMAADDQRVLDRIAEISSAYEESARVRNAIYADEEQLATIEAAVLEEQVVEHILARARVEEVPTSYVDVMSGRALPEEPEPLGPSEEPSAGERGGSAPRMEEPSAGEREGSPPRMEEPSAGEREGSAPRMEEPSAGEREGSAPRRKDDAELEDGPGLGGDHEAAGDDQTEGGKPGVEDEPRATDERASPTGLGGRLRRMFGRRK